VDRTLVLSPLTFVISYSDPSPWGYGRGKPAVKLLNEEYGDSWRLNDRSFYSRRLCLIREIFQLAEDQRRVGDEEAVAREIEKERQRQGKSLN
jgi:Transcriptional activator of glycolytic enzymes